jgi:cytochrome oxidase Cu insertion factor (SCO1/SenC/PrrC family)
VGGPAASPRLVPSRLFLAVGGAALVAGVAVGIALAFLHKPARSTLALGRRADETWAAGVRRAPDFNLRDQAGAPISLRSLRGRPVLLTFIDPVCQNLCPLEAKVLTSAEQQLGSSSGVAIVAVSANPWGNARKILMGDIQEWRLSSSWRWAYGGHTQLAAVWRRYGIGVQVLRSKFQGVPVRRIVHLEASYVIDRNGYERALFLFPFQAGDVAKAVRQVSS